jgi:hypothetical protein
MLAWALMAYMDEEGEKGGRWACLRQRCSGLLVAKLPRTNGCHAANNNGGGRTLLRRCICICLFSVAAAPCSESGDAGCCLPPVLPMPWHWAGEPPSCPWCGRSCPPPNFPQQWTASLSLPAAPSPPPTCARSCPSRGRSQTRCQTARPALTACARRRHPTAPYAQRSVASSARGCVMWRCTRSQ